MSTDGVTIAERYRLDEDLGATPAARTYKATDLRTEQAVIVKVMAWPPTAPVDEVRAQISRVMFEARALEATHHPNLGKVIDAQPLGDAAYFVVEELLEGHTLADELELAGALPPARAQAVLLQLLDALEELHRRGIVHRNLKPSAVMLVRQRGAEVAKLIDVNLGRPLSGAADGKATLLAGTPGYLAPEQLQGGLVDVRADVYALGLLAFELLANRPAFASPDLNARLYEPLFNKVPLLSSVGVTASPAMTSTLARATQPSADDRYPHVRAMRAALVGQVRRGSSSVEAPADGSVPPSYTPPAPASPPPSPFEPVQEALSRLPPWPEWLSARRAVAGVGVVALLLVGGSLISKRTGAGRAMSELAVAVPASCQLSPNSATMLLVRRDGYAVPLTATCNTELRVPAPSKPVLVALETSAGLVVSGQAYTVDADWVVAASSEDFDRGQLEERLDASLDDALGCIGQFNAGQLFSGDTGEFVPVNFKYDAAGQVLTVVSGYIVTAGAKRWMASRPDMACLGNVARGLHLAPLGGIGAHANTKLTYSLSLTGRWP